MTGDSGGKREANQEERGRQSGRREGEEREVNQGREREQIREEKGR